MDANFPSYNSLILIDEIGSGTCPDAGYALSRSILEFMAPHANIICTTHLSALKAFATNHDRFTTASVLLRKSIGSSDDIYRPPTYKLAYNSIGDSHALAAASKCSFPNKILERASELLGMENENVTYVGSLVDALENEKDAVEMNKMRAESLLAESNEILETNRIVALAFERKILRIEERLQEIHNRLLNSDEGDEFEIVGQSLKYVRLRRKTILSDAEKLAKRGLRQISQNYNLIPGEIVTIVKGKYEGETANVVRCDGFEIILSLNSFELDLVDSQIALSR